jgi:hypothetical protein
LAFVVTGTGQIYERTAAGGDWNLIGRGVAAVSRDLPVIAATKDGRLVVASFGGRLNSVANGTLGKEQKLPGLAGKPLGFVDLAASPLSNTLYIAWEEGDEVHTDLKAGE